VGSSPTVRTRPWLAEQVAAAGALLVFIREFEFVLAKTEVSGYAPVESSSEVSIRLLAPPFSEILIAKQLTHGQCDQDIQFAR
jgi:hypothetical protein